MTDNAPSLPQPTDEMMQRFRDRTDTHIASVQKWLQRLDGFGDFTAAELEERGAAHDADKYSEEKVVPYVWVTEYYRLKNDDDESIPEDLQKNYDATRDATEDHVTINQHHPEAHDSPDDMTDLDVAEMVADWSAMAEELGEGSARGWADKNVGSKWSFDDDHVALIYRFIDALEEREPTTARYVPITARSLSTRTKASIRYRRIAMPGAGITIDFRDNTEETMGQRRAKEEETWEEQNAELLNTVTNTVINELVDSLGSLDEEEVEEVATYLEESGHYDSIFDAVADALQDIDGEF